MTNNAPLDPQDWEALRQIGHQMVNDMLLYLQTVRERPTWQPIPDDTRAQFEAPLPEDGQPLDDVYNQFKDHILPYPLGNIHPRFFGWVLGSGTPVGMLAEMLAATMNTSLGASDQVANEVELQVLAWCKEMLGFPENSSGLLVSGGSMANLVGLTVGRHVKMGFDVREDGLQGLDKIMTFYGSAETHSSVQKNIELLGFGNKALRKIPVNDQFQIDLDSLRTQIVADLAAGYHPLGLIGNAGTTATGSIDDLDALADIAKAYNLWFHVDGAFGAMAALSDDTKHMVKGMDRADSLAFDLHKWMVMPYEVGCILVQAHDKHHAAFTLTPDYLARSARGLAGGKVWFSDYGVQLSRSFRALKVWFSLKNYGVSAYRDLITRNVAQAQHFATLVDESPHLERTAPAPLNVVCYRFVVDGLSAVQLDVLNAELLIQIQESGIAVPSNITIYGKVCHRICITNHRTEFEDLDFLVQETVTRGQVLANELF